MSYIKKIILTISLALVIGDMHSQTKECDIIQQMDIQVMPRTIPYMFNYTDTLVICITNYYINDNKNIINQSITASNSYTIEYLRDKKWVEVPLKIDFESNAAKLLFNTPRYFKISLQKEKYHYNPGKYRVVKKITIKDFYTNGYIKIRPYHLYSYFSVSIN